ncbi:MAG: IclR family transcriptional regulator [Deltaproteobacteria bacterium]|nr:IclR family transcriptional regulator [Deltaproteobacteria bacterium]
MTEIKQTNKSKTGYAPLVPAVQQASQILLCLAKNQTFKMRLTDICQQVGIHKSKGYSILHTLKNFGFIEKDPQTKTYSLGPALIFLSGRVLDNIYNQEKVAPFLESLAKETQSTAFFGLIVDSHLFVIAKHEAYSGVNISIRLGYRFPLTYRSHGKAILAFLPYDEREQILASEKLWFYSDTSPVNMEQLREELDRCREVGFAQDLGEIDTRYNSVAAPVFGHNGKVVACLVVVGVFDETLADQYGNKVAEFARKISYIFGADVEQIYERITREELFVTTSDTHDTRRRPSYAQ